MLTERDLKSHEDYEKFARYLGIDYEDYCNLALQIEVNNADVVGTGHFSHKQR